MSYRTQVFEDGRWRDFWPAGDTLKSAKKTLDKRREVSPEGEQWRLIRCLDNGKTQVINH